MLRGVGASKLLLGAPHISNQALKLRNGYLDVLSTILPGLQCLEADCEGFGDLGVQQRAQRVVGLEHAVADWRV